MGDEPFGGFGTTFGRRKGRRLRNHHQFLVDDLLPRITVPLPREGDGLLREAMEPHALFAHSPDEVWLEIGYGGGEHLAGQAKANPDIGFIGGEFFTQGVAKLLALIEEDELSNVRLYAGDARELLASIKPETLSRIFVLYPDPWPKKRHERRRFISPWSITEFSRVLKRVGRCAWQPTSQSIAAGHCGTFWPIPILPGWRKDRMIGAKHRGTGYPHAMKPKLYGRAARRCIWTLRDFRIQLSQAESLYKGAQNAV